ncbi:MAG: PhzF family phenazine biosynthesis protein [Alphaproteobacteria bacterium]|nr:PhzF family phenazine biosynthesis protein [Alphaproteobacteria bacterium]
MKIWTVDAFTDKPFAGNPAAVTLFDEFPSNPTCQKIAAEMNLSETAFVKALGSKQFHIRWFTPEVEVQLCGHATLAAAHVLFEEGIVQNNTITFDSLSGPLFVKKEGKDIILDFPLQKISETLPLSFFDQLFKRDIIVNAVKAYDDVIVELRDELLVRELDLDLLHVKEIDCRGLIVTAKGNPPYDFISRFYAPRVGVNEDPVTGSAHCKLADYWQKKLGKSQFLAYQASPRGGIIGLQIVGDRIHLKGQAITIMEGKWKV